MWYKEEYLILCHNFIFAVFTIQTNNSNVQQNLKRGTTNYIDSIFYSISGASGWMKSSISFRKIIHEGTTFGWIVYSTVGSKEMYCSHP